MDDSQLKDQEDSPETTNKTNLLSLIDTMFEKEIMKIMKELRKAVNKNAVYCKNELEVIKMSLLKLDNSLAKMKTELKTMNSRIYNTRETNK